MAEAGQGGPISDLVRDWRDAGLARGDTVLVHGSVRRTCARGFSPARVLRSFLETVGETGTVLFPLFNFDVCKGAPFDIRNSPSRMGAMTEAARLHPGAVRTGHPAYSFAVIGAGAGAFRGLFNDSGYGEDSPFAMLRKMAGKIAVLDLLGQSSMTFYHHVEQMRDVPYRYHKTFRTAYTDAAGITSDRAFSIFVRDINRGVLTDVDPMDERLWQQGLYTGCRPGEGHGLRVIAARGMFDAVSAVIDAGEAEGMLFSSAR
jgi:aminoglycoside 3-N-acetyltransferase